MNASASWGACRRAISFRGSMWRSCLRFGMITCHGVVFEALAFGKPVIGSRRGGIPEMIRDGENGLLFEPDAPGELRAALQALRDDRRRSRLTEKARPSAAPFLDMAEWIRTYEALYREVAGAGRGAWAAPQEGPDATHG